MLLICIKVHALYISHYSLHCSSLFHPYQLWHVCLVGLILYVPINMFYSHVGTGVPGWNQYSG